MTSYTYLGYGITNENGVAQLKYDENGDELEHSYTGSGVGEVDIVASLDDPDSISDSSLQSETYSIIDATFKDIGTSTDYNETGWSNARIDLTRTDEYTQLVWDGNNNNGLYYRNISEDIAIEFDLCSKKANNNSIVEIYNNWAILGLINRTSMDLVEETWNHIKITLKNGVGVFSNSTNNQTVTFTSTDANRLGLSLRNTSEYTKYKNFVIYPL